MGADRHPQWRTQLPWTAAGTHSTISVVEVLSICPWQSEGLCYGYAGGLVDYNVVIFTYCIVHVTSQS